ncbi:MAG: hypothetical protein A3E87_05620 [Gammaproteobacteria bacterium RIFCSPHIGHO2_12_FULL_35_23]|nr:MAG: hypothetical protein A3E87_05620 [Gammaproteobacteria bacterium RIFCSPHIGHO2_12_FULL_35_23]
MSLLSQQLQAFMAIVEYGTVHSAAESLYLTQTAVTQRLRTLETKLRTTLFVRTRRGMVLTSEGEALLRYCNAAKELEGEALAVIQGAGTKSEVQLSISGPTSIMRSRIIYNCLPVMKKYPNLLLHFAINDNENRHQELRAGHCDLAILQTQDVAKEMSCKELAAEEYILVGPSTWRGRKTKEIIKNERIIDFNPSDQVTFNYLKYYDLFAEAQHSRHFINRTESLAMLVIEGLGYTALPKEFAKPYLDNDKLIVLNSGKTLQVESVLAWYERPEPPAYFSAIINSIK